MNKRLEQLKQQGSDAYYSVACQDAYIDGFDTCAAEYEKILAQMESALKAYAEGTAFDFSRTVRGEVNFDHALSSATAKLALLELKDWRSGTS